MRIRSVVVVAVVAITASITGSLTAFAAGQRGTSSSSGTTQAALQAQTGPPHGSTFTPITPCRIVDTRLAASGAIPGGSTRTFAVDNGGSLADQGGNASGCGIPSDVTAVQANVVSVDATGSGYLTLFPAGGTAPLASFLNFRDGKAVANGGTVTVSSAAAPAFAVRTSRTTDVVVDVSGYYSAPLYASVAADGTLIASSGAVRATSPGTGRFEVTFQRNVVGCAIQATSADPSILIGAGPSVISSARVDVSLLDGGTLGSRSGNFEVTVTC